MVATRLLPAALALLVIGDPTPRAWQSRRSLPDPELHAGITLNAAIARRRSVRQFGARQLGDAEIGQLLWAAQGQRDGHRNAPSAGGLYPLTIRVADARGIWRYLPTEHALEPESFADVRQALAIAAHRQMMIATAPVVLVISGEIAITASKYGGRAERFVTLEAGHAAQNLLLAATSLELAAVPVGAFEDDEVRRLLDMSDAAMPLYVIPVGAVR